MVNAILIAGNGRRFLDDIRAMRGYLQKHVEIRERLVFKAAYASASELLEWFEGAIGRLAVKDIPLLLMYAGHGGKTGWWANDTDEAGYQTLAPLFKLYRGPIVFINMCCYGLSVKIYLEKCGLAGDRLGVIGSASEDEEGSTFAEYLIDDWRARRSFIPGRPIPLIREVLGLEVLASPEEQKRAELRSRALSRLHTKFPKDFPCAEYETIFGWRETVTRIPAGEISHPHTRKCRRWGAELDHYFFPKLQVSAAG